MKSFLQVKQEFDSKCLFQKEFKAFIPVHLKVGGIYAIKGEDRKPNEEYYKWQFFHSLIYSGLYPKDYVGCEVYFPKGNKNSAPIKLDGAIFDDPKWFDWYEKFHNDRDQESLDWLRKHLIGAIEFKKEDSKGIEVVYNQQLKAAMKESESNFCLGILYSKERLYLFQKKNGNYLRFDEAYNLKGDKSVTKDLCLDLPDAYYKIPYLDKLQKKATKATIDRSKRTIDDLDIITGICSKQLSDGVSQILRVMDRLSMKNQRGYEILIQILALKIFDEKRSLNAIPKAFLEVYKSESETKKLSLLFYIKKKEKGTDLSDEEIQGFIKRIRDLYKKASSKYHYILKKKDDETISWDNPSHVQIISEVVEQFQDYSFVNSHKTDLYQIVFSKFANEFLKAEKGQFLTPIPLIDFLVQIVNPRGAEEEIIDPTAGIADFLSVSYVNSINLKNKLDDSNIYGLDNDEHMTMLAQLNMLLNGDGNAILKYQSSWGSITWKFDDRNNLVELQPNLHKNGNWDNWKDQTILKRFDVVLTNPPFGEGRKIEAKKQENKNIIEMYELWHILQKEKKKKMNWIDPGLIFLENAYRVLKDNGRIGIVLSNSIASIDRWEEARRWLIEKMRIVALFDLPANIFADTGVNTTLVVAYKPKDSELKTLQKTNYSIFAKDIKKVGYEVRTSNRVKKFNPLYKINEQTFEVEQNEKGEPLLDEEFTSTIKEFKEWCLGQEKQLQDLFIKQ
jgi:type I restriction enzyme M protein